MYIRSDINWIGFFPYPNFSENMNKLFFFKRTFNQILKENIKMHFYFGEKKLFVIRITFGFTFFPFSTILYEKDDEKLNMKK